MLKYIFDNDELYNGKYICISFNRINSKLRHQLNKFSLFECCKEEEGFVNVEENIDKYCHDSYADCDGCFHYNIDLYTEDEIKEVVLSLVLPFDVYDGNDDVPMPSGVNELIIQFAIDSLNGKDIPINIHKTPTTRATQQQ